MKIHTLKHVHPFVDGGFINIHLLVGALPWPTVLFDEPKMEES